MKEFDLLKDFRAVQESAWEAWEKAKKEIGSSERETIGFIEGPPTMNGEPHLGHLRGRIVKDLFYRVETIKGKKVVFRAGWDTQGLPVELEAEKELGITGNKAQVLSKIGEERLVEKCKELVHRYNEVWLKADRLLGMMFDYEKAYWTYKDGYIEREWRIMKRAYEKGLLYEDYRVVAYCPSCQTSLSNSEVAQGYKEEVDPSLYYKAKLVDEDVYLIVWTTMPFTLVTDEAVGVNPNEEYLTINVNGEKWIVGKTALNSFLKEAGIKDYVVLGSVKGSELEGKRYEPPLGSQVPEQLELFRSGKLHMVLAEEFVDVTTGTGIVHLSPANGEEDFDVAKRRGLPIFNPINDEVKFTEKAGKYAGMFVRDADDVIAQDLKAMGTLVKYGRIKHLYPTCWRSGHKLVFMARREYFYDIPGIGDLALEEASKVNYYFPQPRNRFLEIIKEKKPWCISRERVWGTPLPIWVCTKCGRRIALFSRDEIVKHAKRLPDGPDFELHKPWIDRIIIRCPYCGGDAKREPFVLDTWHNSGAAPYASLTDEEYERLVPAEFLTEGIDQTRGWAYTLLMEGVLFSGRSPYRGFLFLGHVLDEKGEKMSKSKGNVVYAINLLEKYPADLVRLYMIWKASPIDPLNFSAGEMLGRPYQIINTLYNLHLYYSINAGYDGFTWSPKVPADLGESEYWILSRLSHVIQDYLNEYERMELNEMARTLEGFIINDVSQRYVPLIRRDLWSDSPELMKRRRTIYWTLGFILKAVDVLMHPITPYITELLYQENFGEKASVLLEPLPQVPASLIDEGIYQKYEEAWEVVSLINAARMKGRLKRRWPINQAIVYTRFSGDLGELIASLGNAKSVKVVSDIRDIPAVASVRPRQGEVGKLFKRESLRIMNALTGMSGEEMARQLFEKGYVEVEGQRVPFDAFEVAFTANDGYEVAWDSRRVVAIGLERDTGLIAEGHMRDVARRVQYARKEAGLVPTEIIRAAEVYVDDDEVYSMIKGKETELSFLVRAKEVLLKKGKPEGDGYREYRLDDSSIYVKLLKD